MSPIALPGDYILGIWLDNTIQREKLIGKTCIVEDENYQYYFRVLTKEGSDYKAKTIGEAQSNSGTITPNRVAIVTCILPSKMRMIS